MRQRTGTAWKRIPHEPEDSCDEMTTGGPLRREVHPYRGCLAVVDQSVGPGPVGTEDDVRPLPVVRGRRDVDVHSAVLGPALGRERLVRT
jgi:hypothetical protein